MSELSSPHEKGEMEELKALPHSALICRYYVNGKCKFGEECTYRHVDVREGDRPACHFHKKKRCNYGGACRFSHERQSVESNEEKTEEEVALAEPAEKEEAKSEDFDDTVDDIPPWLASRLVSVHQMEAPGGGVSSRGEGTSQHTFCPYYELTGVCENSPRCPLVHGEKCHLCGNYALHPTDQMERRLHNMECVRRGFVKAQWAHAVETSKGRICAICYDSIYEKRKRFGLLENCKHIFCVECIRLWRTKEPVANARSCPTCRTHSDFIVPSIVWVEEADEKELLFTTYRENTLKMQCKYYKPYSRGDCPFGNKCFYKHENPDGTMGMDGPPRRRMRPRRGTFSSGAS